MTISIAPARNEYTANAAQTIFNYTFKIFANTDLNVYITPSDQDANDSTDLTTAYTVTGLGDEDGGTIILSAGTNLNDLVTIVSNVPSSRATDYQNNGDFRPDTVNDDFDRVVSIVKKVEDVTNRTLVSAQSQQGSKPLSLPSPLAQAVMRWKSDLTGFENTFVSELSPGLFPNDAFTLQSTLTAVVADTKLLLGQVYTLSDRGDGFFDVVLASSVIPNGSNIVQCVGAPDLAVKYRRNDIIDNSKSYGVVADGVTDDLAAIQAYQVLNRFIQLPSGDVYVSAPIVLTTGQTLNGKGISHTSIVTDGDYDAIQLGVGADFTQISNFSIRYTGVGQSASSAAYRPAPADGGNNHVLLNLSMTDFFYGMDLGVKWWSSMATNVRCNGCGTDISCFGVGQAINNTFINFYSNKPTVRAIDIRAARNWTFVTPNFGGDISGGFGSYMQIGTNSRGIIFINPNFEGEGAIAYPEGQSGIEILSNSAVTFESPTFTTNVGTGPGLSYEIEARDSSEITINNPTYVNQGANMGKFKSIGTSKITLTGGAFADIEQSGSTTASVSVDEVIVTGFLSEGSEVGLVPGDTVDTGLGMSMAFVEASIVWTGDARATATMNVSDKFSNGTFKVRFTDLATGGVAAGPFNIQWRAK